MTGRTVLQGGDLDRAQEGAQTRPAALPSSHTAQRGEGGGKSILSHQKPVKTHR